MGTPPQHEAYTRRKGKRMSMNSPVDSGIETRRAELTELVDLRHVVLRQGLPREAAVFDGDERPDTRHYGAFRDGRAVCCATLHASTWEGRPAWQLRGMATADGFRGRGIGRDILRLLEADLLRPGSVRLLWCNARVPAVGFYRGMGWRVVSDVFEIPTAGPHVKMVKELAEGP